MSSSPSPPEAPMAMKYGEGCGSSGARVPAAVMCDHSTLTGPGAPFMGARSAYPSRRRFSTSRGGSVPGLLEERASSRFDQVAWAGWALSRESASGESDGQVTMSHGSAFVSAPSLSGRDRTNLLGSREAPPASRQEGVRFALDSPLEEAGFELLVPRPSRTCAEPYRPALTLRKPEDETRKSGRALSILGTEIALSAVVPRRWGEVDSDQRSP
jgi:hypothetical protein